MAATAGGIRAGRAFVEIFADSRALQRGLKQSEAMVRGFGRTVGEIGTKLVAAGGLLGAPLIASTRTFAGFEAQMSRVRAFTADLTDRGFEQLRVKAMQLGEATSFSAAQAAEGMANLALAGFSVQEQLAAIGPTLDLAAAGSLDLGTAASITASAVRSMGLQAGDAGHVADLLARAASTSNTEVGQLGEALKFVGPIAKQAGVSLEEVVAAIQILGDAGIRGEMAGTVLRGGILSLAAPTNDAKARLAALGVETVDAQGRFRGLVAIVGDLQKAMSGMETGTRLQVLEDILAARQAGGFAALIDRGSEALADLRGKLQGADGAAQKMAGTILDNLAGDVTIAKSAIESLAISVGGGLSASLRTGTRGVTTLASGLSLAARLAPEVSLGVGKIAAGLVAVGGSLLGFKVATFLLADLVGLAAKALTPIGLLTTAVGAGAIAAAKWSGAWDTAVEGISTQLSGLPARIAEVNEAARAAFESGDVEGAQRIMLAGLEAEQERFLTTSKQAWDQWGDYVANVLRAAFGGLFGGGAQGRQIPVQRVPAGGQIGSPERAAAIQRQMAAEEANARIALSEGIKADVSAKAQAGEAGGFLLHIEGLLAEGMARLFSGSAAGDAARENAGILSGQAGDQFARQQAARREANAKAAERAAAAADAKVRDAINSTAADASAALQEAANEFAAQGVAETRARLAKQSDLPPEVDALLRDFAALSAASKDLESAERRRTSGLVAVDERMRGADAILEQADAADASLALVDAEAYFRERFGDAVAGLGGDGSVLGTFDARAVETFGPGGIAGVGPGKDDPTKIAKDELAVSKQIKEGIGKLITLFEGFTSNVEAVLDPSLA